MSRSKKVDQHEYTSAIDHPSVQAELVDTPDRVAAILGAAMLDVQLERALRAILIEDKEVDTLLDNGGSGGLGTFAAKSRAAYCLGLISRATLHDLKLLGRVRNAFAHNVLGCSFNNPAVKAWIEQMEILRELQEADSMPRDTSVRIRFNLAMYVLESRITAGAKGAARLHAVEDPRIRPVGTKPND